MSAQIVVSYQDWDRKVVQTSLRIADVTAANFADAQTALNTISIAGLNISGGGLYSLELSTLRADPKNTATTPNAQAGMRWDVFATFADGSYLQIMSLPTALGEKGGTVFLQTGSNEADYTATEVAAFRQAVFDSGPENDEGSTVAAVGDIRMFLNQRRDRSNGS